MTRATTSAIAYAEARTSARRLAAQGRDAGAQVQHHASGRIFLECPAGREFAQVELVAAALANDPAIYTADDALRAAGLTRE